MPKRVLTQDELPPQGWGVGMCQRHSYWAIEPKGVAGEDDVLKCCLTGRDILNGEALLPDHAAALDALAEARKRLKKAADDFIGEGMDWNAQQIYDYLKTSAPTEER